MIALTLFASFLAPELYSAAIVLLLMVAYAHRSISRNKIAFPSGLGSLLVVLLLFSALCVLGPTLNYGGSGRDVDAFKFLFTSAGFMLGIVLGSKGEKLELHFPIFLAAITLFYIGQYFIGNSVDQNGPIYPPDNNNSASMLAVFLPIVIMYLSRKLRITCLAIFAVFSFFVASRALLAFTVVAFAISSPEIRKRRWLLAIVTPVVLAILFYKGLSLDNFSDQIRFQIVQVSLNYAETRGANAFNFGEAAFTNILNIDPIYHGIEFQHAHNLILEIWVAYGIVPLVAFSVFIVGLSVQGWRQRNYPLLGIIGIVVIFGMIESLIMDVRSFGTIMFVLGYGYSYGSKFMASGIQVYPME